MDATFFPARRLADVQLLACVISLFAQVADFEDVAALASHQLSFQCRAVALMSKEVAGMIAEKTFKEAFCDYFQVGPEEYGRKALFLCLYPHAVLFFSIFYPLQVQTVMESMDFIRKVGDTRTDDELDDVISEFHNDIADTSTYWARQCKFRVSAQKVAELNRLIRKQAPITSGAPS